MIPADWGATAREFADYLFTARKSQETVRAYSSSASLFWRWCEMQDGCALAASKVQIRSWLSARREVASSTTIYGNLAALRVFYEFLIDAGAREDNPTKGLTVKRTETLPTEPLLDAELKALFAACQNERDRLIILLLVYSGVRISEFASMTAENIDWLRGTIKIPHGKGDVAGLVQPASVVMDRLRAHLGLFPQGPLWLSQQDKKPMASHQIRKIIYRIAKRAGLEGVHPHRFRSTFACEFIEQTGGDMHALKGAMRHKSVETTGRYVRAAEVRRGLLKMKALTLAV